MSTLRVGRAAAALTAIVLTAPIVRAQNPTAVAQPPRTQEFGVDAGALIGLGDQSSFSVNLPAARARIGFFLSNESRWSIEPAVALSYNKVENVDGVFTYNLEVGALRHFAPPQNVVAGASNAVRSSVAYVRPFVNLTGFSGGASDNEFSAGAGLGIKTPFRADAALRFEANAGYGFSNEAFRLGAFAGVSFFTRNLIR